MIAAEAIFYRPNNLQIQSGLIASLHQLTEPPAGESYGDEEDLTVTVSHTFYLAVPYGGRLFALMDSGNAVDLDFAPGEYGLIIRATSTLTNEGAPDFIEPESFPG